MYVRIMMRICAFQEWQIACDTIDDTCEIPDFTGSYTTDNTTVGHLNSGISTPCTLSGSASSCGIDVTNKDVIYSFTPNIGGKYTISTCGSESNTAIVVREDCKSSILRNHLALYLYIFQNPTSTLSINLLATVDEAATTCKCSSEPKDFRGDCDENSAELDIDLIAGALYKIGK